MQMACKEKERAKKKAASGTSSGSRLASRLSSTGMSWADAEVGDALRGRESMLNCNQRVNATARTAVSVPHNVVNQPADVSQLLQGTTATEENEFTMLPSHPAQLTEGELQHCRQQRQQEEVEDEVEDEDETVDMFANSGTHEMGAGLPPPPPSDDEEEEKGPCQSKCEESNCMKTLSAMLLGLVDEDDRKLGDLSLEPHASMRQKSACAPVADDLKEEAKRRVMCNAVNPMPKPTWWSKTKAEKWLMDNAIEALGDVEFLIATEAKVRAELENEIKEREELHQERAKANGNWTDICPCSRPFCCMCDDRARDALLTKDNGWDRQELDARNHEDRPETWCEVITDLCNDPENVCETQALPELHAHFCKPIESRFEDMPGGEIAAEQVRGRHGDS